MHIVVLGTGIVGTCTGAWLQRDGHRITFVSPVPPGQACSFGNAGSLSPSACLPVGMPGMWKQVPGWLSDPEGPLAIQPAYLPQLLPWLLRYAQGLLQRIDSDWQMTGPEHTLEKCDSLDTVQQCPG